MPSFSKRVVSDQPRNAPPSVASKRINDQENQDGLLFSLNSISGRGSSGLFPSLRKSAR